MRSKPDPVDQPERTDAHYDCVMCINVEMLHNTRLAQTVLLISPFLQTNITVQMPSEASSRDSIFSFHCLGFGSVLILKVTVMGLGLGFVVLVLHCAITGGY